MDKQLLKQAFRVAITVLITVLVGHYYSLSEKFWLPLSALLVMQTPTGSSLHHGLRRYLVIGCSIIIGSLCVLLIKQKIILDVVLALVFASGCFIAMMQANYFSRLPILFLSVLIFLIAVIEPVSSEYLTSMHFIYVRAADITLGAAIGLIANLVIFPNQPDVEFRQRVIPIINAYSDYLIAITNLILCQPDAEKSIEIANEKRILVETTVQNQFPEWVFEYGFNIQLRQGHRHFLITLERINQILFSMHHAARYVFETRTRHMLGGLLRDCTSKATQMFMAVVSTLELKNLKEGIEDFDQDIDQLEQTFQTSVAPSIELLDFSDEYMNLAAFIYDLKDLRKTLLKLLEALR